MSKTSIPESNRDSYMPHGAMAFSNKLPSTWMRCSGTVEEEEIVDEDDDDSSDTEDDEKDIKWIKEGE